MPASRADRHDLDGHAKDARDLSAPGSGDVIPLADGCGGYAEPVADRLAGSAPGQEFVEFRRTMRRACRVVHAP